MSANVTQWRIIFFANGQNYDTEYVGLKRFQENFAKLGLSSKPFANYCAGCIVSIALISKGKWFDKEIDKYWWSCGPYCWITHDVVALKKPVSNQCYSQNIKLIDANTWYDVVKNNPFIVNVIKSWSILYHQHLANCKTFGNIYVKTLRMPWATLQAKQIKLVENLKSPRNFKIDPTDSQHYHNVRCCTCVHKIKQCDNCNSIQKKMR